MTGKNTFFQSLKKNKVAWAFLLPSILLFYFTVWRPIAAGTYLSFFDLDNTYHAEKFVGFANYKAVLTDTLFLKTFVNTVKYVLWSFVIGFIPPIFIAIMVNEVAHFKSFFKFSMYFPNIVPSVATALIWYFMMQPNESGILNMVLNAFGLGNYIWLQDSNATIPLIVFSMTWRTFGATMIMYLATLSGINQELYEAATLDGAGLFARIRHITLPYMSPTILLFAIRQIIGVFQTMIEPMTMTDGGPNNASLSLSLQAYKYAFSYFQAERSLALGVVIFLILIGFSALYFKLDKKLAE